MRIHLLGQTYDDQDKQFSSQRTINMYYEPSTDQQTKNRGKLTSVEGFESVVTASPNLGSGCRLLYASPTGRMFAVYGNTFYELTIVSSVETLNEIGTINTTIGNIEIAENRFNITFVDGVNGYLFDLTANTLTVITDPLFPVNPIAIAHNNVYYAVSDGVSGIFDLSKTEANDPTDFMSGDFANAESKADRIVKIISMGGEFYFFGTDSIDPWYSNGSTDFPYSSNTGAIQDIGTVSAGSVQRMQNSLYFVGNSKDGYGIIYALEGYRLRVISTDPIESELQRAGQIDSVFSYTYQNKGNFFYVLNVIALNKTFVYNATTGMWHELAFLNNGNYTRHESTQHCFAFGKNYISDYSSNEINVLRNDIYQFGGRVMSRERVMSNVFNEYKSITVNEIELGLQKGKGDVSGSDPKVELSLSKDGGMSDGVWIQKSIGKLGEFEKRVRFWSLGSGNDIVPKIRYTENTSFSIWDAFAEIEINDD